MAKTLWKETCLLPCGSNRLFDPRNNLDSWSWLLTCLGSGSSREGGKRRRFRNWDSGAPDLLNSGSLLVWTTLRPRRSFALVTSLSASLPRSDVMIGTWITVSCPTSFQKRVGRRLGPSPMPLDVWPSLCHTVSDADSLLRDFMTVTTRFSEYSSSTSSLCLDANSTRLVSDLRPSSFRRGRWTSCGWKFGMTNGSSPSMFRSISIEIDSSRTIGLLSWNWANRSFRVSLVWSDFFFGGGGLRRPNESPASGRVGIWLCCSSSAFASLAFRFCSGDRLRFWLPERFRECLEEFFASVPAGFGRCFIRFLPCRVSLDRFRSWDFDRDLLFAWSGLLDRLLGPSFCATSFLSPSESDESLLRRLGRITKTLFRLLS